MPDSGADWQWRDGIPELRLHADDERREFHPLAGHGYAKETGWTHPDLEPKK